VILVPELPSALRAGLPAPILARSPALATVELPRQSGAPKSVSGILTMYATTTPTPRVFRQCVMKLPGELFGHHTPRQAPRSPQALSMPLPGAVGAVSGDLRDPVRRDRCSARGNPSSPGFCATDLAESGVLRGARAMRNALTRQKENEVPCRIADSMNNGMGNSGLDEP
jgi:hypothetical protein